MLPGVVRGWAGYKRWALRCCRWMRVLKPQDRQAQRKQIINEIHRDVMLIDQVTEQMRQARRAWGNYT